MKRNAGLTYLELLIVLMLLAVIAVLIGGAFDFVRQSKERAIEMADREGQVILRGLFRGWVETMSPVTSENNFHGSAEGFSFNFSQKMQAKPNIQLLSIDFRITNNSSAEIALTGFDALGQTLLEKTRVFEPLLQSFSLEYYGKINDSPARWHPEWREDHLPRLIRFQATRENGDPMPPLTIRPGVQYSQSVISLLFPSPPT